VGTTTYAYDTLSRLTSATSSQSWNNFSQSYTYDLLGNITNKSDVGTYTYANTGYANPDAATAINGVTYTYDNSDNLIQYGNTTNSWSYRDRLTNTNDGNGISATTTAYRYDENDQRVAQDTKNGSGGTTTTTYFSNLYEKAGGTTTLYVYAGTQLVATIEGNGVSTSTYVTHTDHLNSSAVQSDKNGNLAQLTQYYPYGGMIQNAQPSNGFNEHRKYIGQTYDDATQLSYLQMRYYSGGNGKFISQDPVARDVGMMQKQSAYILALNQTPRQVDQYAVLSDPQTLNFYTYSKNNPIIYGDPSGLFYYQASAGGSLLLISGSAGFQWNNEGANFFVSAGPALSVGVHGELTPFATGMQSGNLPDGGLSVSRLEKFIMFAGFTFGTEGKYDPSKPFSNGTDISPTGGITVGAEIGVSQEYTKTIPIYRKNNNSNSTPSVAPTNGSKSALATQTSVNYTNGTGANKSNTNQGDVTTPSRKP
jgi:RHS repeat-associated protein